MELFRQRNVNIKITISGEEKNSRNNEMSIDVDILSESALKNIYDEFYSKIYMLNETKQEAVEQAEHGEDRRNEPEEMNVEDIPF